MLTPFFLGMSLLLWDPGGWQEGRELVPTRLTSSV